MSPDAPTRPLRVVLATANAHKVDELRAMVGDRLELVARPAGLADVIEDADTFEGNARLKAVAVVEATGEVALADDSGLEVDALGGAPGVRSARFAEDAGLGVPGPADAANTRRLLAELARSSPARSSPALSRRARFRTVMVLRWPDGCEIVASGSVEGWILDAPRGEGGFGYDPVFVPTEGDGRSFAELAPTEKNAMSHRRRALEDLFDSLDALRTC